MTVALTEPPPPSRTVVPASPAPMPSALRWPLLLAQLSDEVDGPVAAALDRLEGLVGAGRIDGGAARELREVLVAARRAASVGRQLARHAGGRVQSGDQEVLLAATLRDLLARRRPDFDARGLAQRVQLVEARVRTDAAALSIALGALVDWCLEHAQGAVDCRLALAGWPIQARLHLRFAYAAPRAASGAADRLDTLSWRLLEQRADALGLPLERRQEGIETEVRLVFPQTLPAALAAFADETGDDRFAPSTGGRSTQSLAGSHVLVVALRREVRQQVREALAHLGLLIDFVASVEEAHAFCEADRPHALVYEGALAGTRLERLRDALRATAPHTVFIELVEDGDRLERSGTGSRRLARVGRRALRAGLPFALKHELAKTL